MLFGYSKHSYDLDQLQTKKINIGGFQKSKKNYSNLRGLRIRDRP